MTTQRPNPANPVIVRTAQQMFAVFSATILLAIGECFGQAAIGFQPTWQVPDYSTIRTQMLDWLNENDFDQAATERVTAQWPTDAPVGLALLESVIEGVAAVDPRAQELMTGCRQPYKGPRLPESDWLERSRLPPFVDANLRLYYGRWLAQHELYDEALAQLDDVHLTDVVDPAALLFYRMVAHHQLVHPDEARVCLVQLLERESELPRRYQQVAQLVQRDLSTLKDESLDHIARRMSDIRRRLDHGRAGDRVQTIERGVVESLDKMIEQLEKQQQQQQQMQQAQSSGGPRSMQPMQDSSLPSMKAPGQVDRRDIGNNSGWGDLPPKQREQALQQIGRDFPVYYRDVIEQYFRELANGETDSAR